MLFIDDYSGFRFVFYILSKNVLECFKKVEVESHRFTGNDIRILKSDNGGEYVKTDFKVFFLKNLA